MSDEPDLSAPLTPDPRPTPRVTYWGNVSYQYGESDLEPVTVEIRSSSAGLEGEQVYVRHLKAGPFWKALDTGWVKNPWLVAIKNTEPAGSNKIVEVGFSSVTKEPFVCDVVIPPQAALVMYPKHTRILLRADDATSYTITATPG